MSADGRQAKLRQKGGCWASDAGGKTTYFGRVTEVSHATAMCKLHEHLATVKAVPRVVVDVQPGVDLTVTLSGGAVPELGPLPSGHEGTQGTLRHLQRFRDPSEICLPWK